MQISSMVRGLLSNDSRRYVVSKSYLGASEASTYILQREVVKITRYLPLFMSQKNKKINFLSLSLLLPEFCLFLCHKYSEKCFIYFSYTLLQICLFLCHKNSEKNISLTFSLLLLEFCPFLCHKNSEKKFL